MLGAVPWTGPLDQVLADLRTRQQGLSQSDAAERLAKYGLNEALSQRQQPLWRQLAERLANPLILILLFAAGLSALSGQTASFAVVLVILSLSVVLDVSRQRGAEAAIDALRKSVAVHSRVIRDGIVQSIPVERLVPGDIVKLAAGDIIPADCRLTVARDLFVNQAILTGESFPVEKRTGDLARSIGDAAGAANCLFMGTSVISGTATAVVCRTGLATELGNVAGTLARHRPPDAFEHGIRRFGYLMLRFTIFLVLFVLAANAYFHRPWLDSLLFALALAVGLTPELLPMVVTVTLANGARRMAGDRVIVKRLPAIHDLGAMDVLCTDKTGTLTEARIQLVHHLDASGWKSRRVLQMAQLNSAFETGIKSPLDDAILAHENVDLADWRKIDEAPFDFERRRVSVLVDDGTTRMLVVKGAPEDIIQLSSAIEVANAEARPIDMAARERLCGQFEQLGEEGYRVLAVACRSIDPARDSAAISDESELTFVGFLAFVDPPKQDAATAIASLARSGVDIKILTGDNERITRHVCREIGFPITGVLTGQDLRQLSEEALRARLASVNLLCRLNPQQKERVLLALKRGGSVVGFLGDGINDASALHAADVGISVDSAADVAKAAADLVLLDHDLAAVHRGVLEGRRTVENVTKYILMGASSNLGNMFSMAGAALFLPFLPMLPTQVLLNNLLYDLSEVGVPFDNVDAEALEMPVHWDLRHVERFMLILGPISSLFDFLTFYALLRLFEAGETLFQTGWFIESLATQALVIFVIRSRRSPLQSRPHPLLTGLSVGVVAAALIIPNTALGPLLGFIPPPPLFYVFLFVMVTAYLALVEVAKQCFYRLAH
jgi:P-type Mg2+ transporter